MGLSFSAEHILDASTAASPSAAADQLFDRVLEGVRAGLEGTPLAPLFEVMRDEASLALGLHPAEEPVRFELVDGLRVRCTARTSSAGPGYHAFALEMLERAFAASGLRWRWRDQDRELGDVTGYLTHRDTARLQEEMLRWLEALAEHVLEEDEDGGGYAISMPLGFQLVGDYFAISATGYKSREFFEGLGAEVAETRQALAREFFPWWDPGFGPSFWDGMARVLCWTALPWRVPVDDREVRLFELARESLDRASFPAPSERQEIEVLLAADSEVQEPPRPVGMGFRRQPMRQALGDGWSVVVPGYYLQEVGDDGNPIFWFGPRTLRAASFGVRGVDRDALVEQGLADGQRVEEELRFEAGHLAGRAVVLRMEDGEDAYWMLQGVVAADERMVLTTICFTDEADREWAVETWHSVMRPPSRTS